MVPTGSGNHSGINKAYLSEFENGKRKLPEDSLRKVEEAFAKHQPAGKARPELRVADGRVVLVFLDEQGHEGYRPGSAHLRWTEDDGTSYSMFIGSGAPK